MRLDTSDEIQQLDGLVGIAARVIDALGEVGVGVLTFVETIFPPIPSEVVLPLAGFLSSLGGMNIVLALIAATLGAYLGALVLYALGAKLGLDRSVRLLSKLPLVDAEDFEKSAEWFSRHGRSSVFFGRLIPGVRSLVSLPAGATRMPIWQFSIFTALGSALWNGLLIGLGAALGSQYELIDQYSHVLDYIVIAVIIGIVVWLVVRRIRRRRRASRDEG
ncbi:MAG: DedA family protein [Microbacteriaceae bacterium]